MSPSIRARLACLLAVAVASSCTSADPTMPATSADRTGVGADATPLTHPQGNIVATLPLPNRPFGAAIRENRAVYVTELDGAVMDRANLPTLSFTAKAPVGSIPTNVAFAPTGPLAFVTNQGNGNVGYVNVNTNTQVATVPINASSFNVISVRNNTKLYVTNNSNDVVVIDVAARAVVRVIPVGGVSNGITLNSTGSRAYVSVVLNGIVAEVNTANDSILRTFAVGGIPQDLAVAKNGSELYIGNENGNLQVLNLASGQIVATVPLASGAFGLALSPDQAQLYVGLVFGGGVVVINRQTRQVVKTIPTGGIPRKIAFNGSGNTAVIANESGWADFVQ